MVTPYQHALARSAAYEYLSAAFLYPGEPTVQLLRNNGTAVMGLLGALGALQSASALHQTHTRLLADDLSTIQGEYLRIFGHTTSKDCPPCEGEYGQASVFQMSQTLADIGSFYRAFGLEPSPDTKERLDHISVELEFMHVLSLKEAVAVGHGHGEDKVLLCQRAQTAFLSQHLGTWAGGFAQGLTRRAGEGVYWHLGKTLRSYLLWEMKQLHVRPEPAQPVPELALADEATECDECPLAPAGSGGEAP